VFFRALLQLQDKESSYCQGTGDARNPEKFAFARQPYIRKRGNRIDPQLQIKEEKERMRKFSSSSRFVRRSLMIG
jgi:hypothetical protein